MQGESNAGTKKGDGQSGASTQEGGKEGNWNQIKDGRLKSLRARCIEEDDGCKQRESSADEHGLVLPAHEFCQVHMRIATVTHLDAAFDSGVLRIICDLPVPLNGKKSLIGPVHLISNGAR